MGITARRFLQGSCCPSRSRSPCWFGTASRAESWGYGPPRFLTVERVRLAAQELSQTSYDDLIRDVNHTELTAADAYPQGWDSRASLEWARDYYGHLATYLRAAADAGDAVLVWLDRPDTLLAFLEAL